MSQFKAYEMALGAMWVMEPGALDQLLTIAHREGDVDAAREIRQAREILALRPGRQLEGASPTSTIRDGVATIKVLGPIFPRANLLTEHSGATSCEVLGRDLQAALDASSVRAILLDVDSPGGQVGGTHEIAQAIRGARGAKPIHAYVSDTAASGAYWIASAAADVTLARTAAVGSIGAIQMFKAGGDKGYIKVRSAASPLKQPSVETEDGRAHIQEQLDAIAAIFVDEVATNRGVPVKKVLTDFGRGGMLVGEHAIKARMADRVGTYESAHARLARGGTAGKSRPRRDTPSMQGQPMSSSLFERIGRAVMGNGADLDAADEPAVGAGFPAPGAPAPAPAPPAAVALTTFAVAEPDPEMLRLKGLYERQVAAVPDSARAFADRAVSEHGYTPAERPYLAALAQVALSAELQGHFPDGGLEVALNDGGKVTVASASDLLGRLVAERPKSPLTREQLAAARPADNGSAGGPSVAERAQADAAAWAEKNIR